MNENGLVGHYGVPETEALSIIAVIEKNRGPYWDMVNAGLDDACRCLRVAARVLAPAYEDVAAQVEMAEVALADGANAIAFVATDATAFTNVCAQARAKGVPTVTIDLDSPQTGRLMYVGTQSPYSLGQMAGQLMLDQLCGPGPVLIHTGSESALGAVGKVAGFTDVMDQANIEYIIYPSDGERLDVALAQARRSLDEHPDAAGVYGVYGYHPVTLGAAIEEHGLGGRLATVGFDALPETVDLIRSGLWSASVWIREYYFGYHTAAILHHAHRLGEVATLELLGMSDLPVEDRTLRLSATTLNRANVERFALWSTELGVRERTSHSLKGETAS